MRRPKARRIPNSLIAAAAATLVFAGPAGAQQAVAPSAGTATAYAPADVLDMVGPAPKDPVALEAERALKGEALERIRQDLALSEGKRTEIAAEIAAIGKDMASVNEMLVATAGKVQGLEQSISESEARLVRHGEHETEIRASLAGRRAVLAEVLAAAQRIGRRPPPALVVRPEDALGAVRSAILLGAVLPEIRIEAESLASDLDALIAVRRETEAERDRLRGEAGTLVEEQERLAQLIAEKRRRSETIAAALASEEKRAAELAAEASSLEELMMGLEREIASVRRAAEAAAAAAGLGRPAPTDGARLQPAIAFEDAKGRLSLPVRGVTVENFGEDNGLGAKASGISVATRAGARVTAPADGWVVYAGPFRSYGQLLILNAGDGYHVVLAGLERIDVELGQFVLTGEPVGSMGSQRLASAAAPDASLSQPVLYIEFRKNGASIDPSPWWAGSLDRKVRG